MHQKMATGENALELVVVAIAKAVVVAAAAAVVVLAAAVAV